MTDTATARRHMVDGQVRTADVTDPRILSAMLEIPRENFVPRASAGLAYLDISLPVNEAGAPKRCLLTPMVLARLIQALGLAPTDRVLVVGCATGYSVAVLARIAAQVVGLEEDARLAQAAKDALASQPNVTIATGTLSEGWAGGAPYDAILIDGSVERLPDAFRRQLREGGTLACVLGPMPASSAMLYRRSGDELGGRPIFDAAAALLPGFAKEPVFAF